MLSVPNPENITKQYMNTYFHQFFNSTDLQLWSMTNRVEKHQGNYITYKFHARDLVVRNMGEVNDPYKLKIKRQSLMNIVRFKKLCEVIDSDYKFHYDINPSDFYNPNNSFV
jgi:hypothetical protein